MSNTSYAVLIVLRPKYDCNERYIILAPQNSHALGVPTGTLSSITSAVLASTGLKIHINEAIDLNPPSPSGQSRRQGTRFLVCEEDLSRKEIEGLKHDPQDPNAPRMCRYDVLWGKQSVDARTLEAWRLYEEFRGSKRADGRRGDPRGW